MLLALLLLLPALAYANAIGNGFIWDDFPVLTANPAVTSLENIPSFFTDPKTGANHPGLLYYRPLRTTLHALTYSVSEFNPVPYHLLNVALHLGNVLLTFLIWSRISARRHLAAAVALLFGVHPLTSEAVSSVTGLTDVLYVTFSLLAVWAHLNLSNRPRLMAPTVMVALALALFSKESAAVVPLLILVHDALFGRPLQKRRYLTYVAALVGLVLGFFLLRYSLIGAGALGEYKGVTLPRTMLMQATVLARYLLFAVFPFGLSIRHTVPVPESFLTLPIVLSGFLLTAVLIWAALKAKKKPLITFGIAWFFITLLPYMNLLPLPGAMMGERFCYFGLSGLLMALAVPLARSWKRFAEPFELNSSVLVPSLVIAIVIGTLTVYRNFDWRDNLSIFEAAAKVAPRSNAVHIMLIREYQSRGENNRAQQHLIAASRITQDNRDLYNRMGDRAVAAGRPVEAVKWFQKAQHMDPRDPHAKERLERLEQYGNQQ